MDRTSELRVETFTDDRDAVCVRMVCATSERRTIVTEVAPPHRLRITEHGTPILWAAGHASLWGAIVLVERPAAPLPHLRAEECRRVREQHPNDADWWTAWAVRFTSQLFEAGPVGRGTWTLERALVTDDRSSRTVRTLKHRLIDRSSHDERHDAVVELDWSLAGENPLLPLRSLGPDDEGRLKAFTKLAADGSLPPALVWWHSGLQRHVILDGHVRLGAFARADKPLLALALSEERPAREAAAIERYADVRAAAATRTVTDPDVLSRTLARIYDFGPLLDRATTAVPLPGGAAAWNAEVDGRSSSFSSSVSAFLVR